MFIIAYNIALKKKNKPEILAVPGISCTVNNYIKRSDCFNDLIKEIVKAYPSKLINSNPEDYEIVHIQRFYEYENLEEFGKHLHRLADFEYRQLEITGNEVFKGSGFFIRPYTIDTFEDYSKNILSLAIYDD
jgi:hypothetical protein